MSVTISVVDMHGNCSQASWRSARAIDRVSEPRPTPALLRMRTGELTHLVHSGQPSHDLPGAACL